MKANFIIFHIVDPKLFDFFYKGLELDSPPHFVCDFSRKMFLLL